ncbi:MAG: metal-dependent hydrolase [Bacteroidota bacterium]
MIIGHLPAGYLAATAAVDRFPVTDRRRLLGAALAASVAPDLDLLYFYTLGGDIHHHAFPTHWPLLWLAMGGIGLAVAAVIRSRAVALSVAFATGAALLHIALDSIAGEVRWGAPFSDASTTLVEIPVRFDWWVWNMLLHWTFAVEAAITVAALVVLWHRRARRTAQ